MIIMNKLIYDGIIGIDLLNVLYAKIDISNNKIICTYKGVQHNVKMVMFIWNVYYVVSCLRVNHKGLN